MSAIDMHVHAFPDNVAERAMARLTAESHMPAVGDGTVTGLLESMGAADIDVSVLCAIATKPDQVKGIVKWCKKIRSNRIEPLASVHPETPKATRWLERIAREKLIGIKLHPMYQDFAADEHRLDDIYAAAADLGLLVEIHSGQDIGFPPDDDRASPRRLARVKERFPKLRLLCTHMGGWKAWDQVEQVLVGTDVYFETSFSLPTLGVERAVRIIRAHGPEKVVFGTDWPWRDQGESIAQVKALGLDEAETRALLWSNGARLLKY